MPFDAKTPESQSQQLYRRRFRKTPTVTPTAKVENESIASECSPSDAADSRLTSPLISPFASPQQSPKSQRCSHRTYTNLTDREIRPARGTMHYPETSAYFGNHSRVSRERLSALPPLNIIVHQACKRMYEDSPDHTEKHIQEHARTVCLALEKQKYDLISFLVVKRKELTTLVSEGVMSLQLLALILERIADCSRVPRLRQDLDGVPSDEQAALMVDRFLRRTAEIMLDGTIEVATTMMANKVCRSPSKDCCHRPSVMRATRLRGHSSRQRTTVPNLPITARVHYSGRDDIVHFEADSADVYGDAIEENEAPTPARFTHFGESPKSLLANSPKAIFEQSPVTTSPARWSHVGLAESFPAAQAA